MATISIDLPPQTYIYWQVLSGVQQRSLEQVLQEQLIQLADQPLPLIEDLESYSDEALQDFLAQGVNMSHQQVLRYLIERGQAGHLSEAEQQTLNHHLAYESTYNLLRSKVFALLKQRGYDLTPFFRYPE